MVLHGVLQMNGGLRCVQMKLHNTFDVHNGIVVNSLSIEVIALNNCNNDSSL